MWGGRKGRQGPQRSWQEGHTTMAPLRGWHCRLGLNTLGSTASLLFYTRALASPGTLSHVGVNGVEKMLEWAQGGSVEGRGCLGAAGTPEAPALPGQTCHPWSMATPKDALCSVKLLCNSSLSPGLWRFCQWMSQSLRDRVPVLPLGTPIYIPVPFSVVCDNMPDCKPERPSPWHTSLSANCCEWRWDGKAFMSCSYTSKSGVPNPEAVAPISL